MKKVYHICNYDQIKTLKSFKDRIGINLKQEREILLRVMERKRKRKN
jgi:hypothetical protein